MIITSEKKLELNKTYDEIFFNGPFEMMEEFIPKYTFLVIRECSLQEYRDFLNKTYPREIAEQIINYEYFYEIHSD